MAAVMKWIGVLWAIIGVANIVLVPSTASQAVHGFGLVFNMLLFIMPGLVVAGIGLSLQRRASAAASAAPASVETRLEDLERLRSRQMITEDEYKAKREELLRIV